jgi:hypothetical protein
LQEQIQKEKKCWKADKKEKPAVAEAMSGEVGKTRIEKTHKILIII